MRQPAPRPISGHVFKRKGKRGAVWYAKYRLPDGRQQKRRLGPAWTEKTAPPDGYFTKGKAQAHLDELLRQVRDGSLPGMVKTGKTFTDATAEWLAYCENVRDCKPSTMRDYRNMVRVLDREFGKRKIETITAEDIDMHWPACSASWLWSAKRAGSFSGKECESTLIRSTASETSSSSRRSPHAKASTSAASRYC